MRRTRVEKSSKSAATLARWKKTDAGLTDESGKALMKPLISRHSPPQRKNKQNNSRHRSAWSPWMTQRPNRSRQMRSRRTGRGRRARW